MAFQVRNAVVLALLNPMSKHASCITGRCAPTQKVPFKWGSAQRMSFQFAQPLVAFTWFHRVGPLPSLRIFSNVQKWLKAFYLECLICNL